MIVGTGSYKYQKAESWPKLGKYWKFKFPSDAAVNADGIIYVLDRGSAHPVTMWDKDGNFIYCWGEGYFSDQPHGIYVAPNGNVWVTDRDFHLVTEFSPGGQPLRKLGKKLAPSPTWHGRFIKSLPFNMPTNLAIASTGEIFVADGYGNHRVHKFNPEGELLLSWGRQGTGPGEFALVHNVWVDKFDRVLVNDDENHRIQIFDLHGQYLEEWKMTNPSGLCIHDDVVYVSQLGPYPDSGKGPGWGSVSLWNLEGQLITQWVGTEGPTRDILIAPHDLGVDDEGSIYVCEGDRGEVGKFRKVA